MTDKQNFEKDINVPSKRPDWRITLQSDHITRLEQDLDFERTKRKSLQVDLKAKEQECEKLKKQYNCYACGTCNGKEDYRNLERHHIGLRKSFDELHKQLDQLKKELEQEKAWHKTSDEISKVNSEYTVKLKQTLTEIKEIAEKHKATAHCCYLEDMTEILQKISECEVEDE